jgi:hypothetical protein
MALWQVDAPASVRKAWKIGRCALDPISSEASASTLRWST